MAVGMSYLAGVQARYFAILGGSLAVGLPLLWNVFLNNEHRNRILALFDLDGNALTTYGWQQYQGKVSIASGQAFGSGLYNGRRVEFGIVPEQENDFIFTVAGEEFGFIGCLILLAILFSPIL
jgi:rod shape determining protein RodA